VSYSQSYSQAKYFLKMRPVAKWKSTFCKEKVINNLFTGKVLLRFAGYLFNTIIYRGLLMGVYHSYIFI